MSAGRAEAALPVMAHGIADLEVGMYAHYRTVIRRRDILAFARLTGDSSPLHVDPEYARGTALGTTVAHGMLTGGHFSTVVGMLLPGRNAMLLDMHLEFAKPIPAGSEVVISGRVASVHRGPSTIRVNLRAYCAGELCAAGTAAVKVREA